MRKCQIPHRVTLAQFLQGGGILYRGEIYEPFMELKSQVELTPPQSGQLGR